MTDHSSLSSVELVAKDPRLLASFIDHTLLKPEALEGDIQTLCQEAAEYRFKSVCVESRWLPLTKKALRGTGVLSVTVISFPHGTDTTSEKVKQSLESVARGADELDMVLNRDWLRARELTRVFQDIREVVQAAESRPVKVILETSELTNEEKIMASTLSIAAGAAFVKTSTGFSKSGANELDVRLMRSVVGPTPGVKASGGVRSLADALTMIRAGASRLGTSASVAIVKGIAASGGGY